MHVEFISKIGGKKPNVFVLRHHHIRSNADILINFIAILKGGIAHLIKLNFKIDIFPSASPAIKMEIRYLPHYILNFLAQEPTNEICLALQNYLYLV